MRQVKQVGLWCGMHRWSRRMRSGGQSQKRKYLRGIVKSGRLCLTALEFYPMIALEFYPMGLLMRTIPCRLWSLSSSCREQLNKYKSRVCCAVYLKTRRGPTLMAWQYGLHQTPSVFQSVTDIDPTI